jgi:type I restriction enzyme S subunit
MSFPKYPKYKDSGVEWLGEVPEHWSVKRLKHCVRLVTVKAEERNNPVALENIEGWTGRLIPSEGEYQGEGTAFAENDILFGKLRPYLAKVYLAMQPGEAVGDFHVLRPLSGIGGRFAQYHMLTREFIDIVDGSTYGSKMPRASWEFVGSMPLAVPLPDEQSRVASFLDRETAKIDELVAEQRRLIELLKEKRQAVISHAVTKGLNPHAPMKPSGIEWLGDVPEHWELKRFQRCVDVAEGQVDPEDVTYSGMSLIAPNHIESGTGRLLSLETADDQGAESGKYLCNMGDVVYSKIRPALRKVCIAPEDCLCSADMYPLRSHSGLTNPFLMWLMLSEHFSALAVLESQRVAMPKINRESLKAVVLAIPPSSEQDTIVDFLQEATARFDSLTAEAQRAIDLLQERRTALISAAVTGKIDVRGLIETGGY